MGCRLLEALILAIISALLLWEGVRCNNPAYSLNVLSPVTVQEGLCVTIPCNFTYDMDDDDPWAPLYGYWFAGNDLVATNDLTRRDSIEDRFVGRFEMSGPKLNQNDCSLTIRHAKANDGDPFYYYFRMEKGKRAKFNYDQEGRRVILKVIEAKPDLTVSEPLRAGHKASLVCTAQRCSPSDLHAINVIGFPENYTFQNGMDTKLEGRLEFIPSAADHQRHVTCQATYNIQPSLKTARKTITLNVRYPPRKIQFSGELTFCNGSVQEFNNESMVVVTPGVKSLLVNCKADSNPPVGNTTWVKKPQFSTAHLPATNNTLELFDLKLQDRGEYTCRAENQEGSADGVFYLQMPHGPVPCGQQDSICRKEDDRYKCNCSICSYPSPRIEWQVDGKVYEKNTTTRELQVTFWNKPEGTAFSTLHLLGDWKENTSVICRGSNLIGQLPIKHQLLGNRGSISVTSAVVGALLMFAIVMFIGIIAVACPKCQKKNKPMTNPESYTKSSSVVPAKKAQDAEGSCATVMNLQEAKDTSKELKETAELPDPNPHDDKLHYASIKLTLAHPVLELTSEETETEYAQIKHL